MFCWNCRESQEKITLRSVCQKCGECMHCCKGCKYFQLGLSNNCQIPGTERVADRTANNYCEEFSPIQTFMQKEKKLDAKKKFEDLFSP